MTSPSRVGHAPLRLFASNSNTQTAKPSAGLGRTAAWCSPAAVADLSSPGTWSARDATRRDALTGYTACLMNAKLDPLLQTMATNGSLTIFGQRVSSRGAKGT